MDHVFKKDFGLESSSHLTNSLSPPEPAKMCDLGPQISWFHLVLGICRPQKVLHSSTTDASRPGLPKGGGGGAKPGVETAP